MKEHPSITTVRSVLQSTARTPCRVTREARNLLGALGDLLDEFGLPTTQGDWFHAIDEVDVYRAVERIKYQINGDSVEVAKPVRIGGSAFGVVILDCSSGHVVYIDQSGETQLINTTFERFLYFVGRFYQSMDTGFSDATELRIEYETLDPAPLQNPDGIWSLTLEEVEAGLY